MPRVVGKKWEKKKKKKKCLETRFVYPVRYG